MIMQPYRREAQQHQSRHKREDRGNSYFGAIAPSVFQILQFAKAEPRARGAASVGQTQSEHSANTVQTQCVGHG